MTNGTIFITYERDNTDGGKAINLTRLLSELWQNLPSAPSALTWKIWQHDKADGLSSQALQVSVITGGE